MDMTRQAREGYDSVRFNNIESQTCPYYKTSPAEMAWAIGRWMAQTHRTMPRDCRTSRGDTMHINGMKVRINYVQGCTEIERIA